MERLRRVLVERYIGLVMVCVFVYQAVSFAGRILEEPFSHIVIRVYNQNRPIANWIPPVSGGYPASMTIWQVIFSVVSLLIAIGLYRWLYPSRKGELEVDSPQHEES